MKKLFFFTGFFLFIILSVANAQHYIGLDKQETKLLARKSGFYPDNMTTSKKFNYLKFVNSSDTKTLIVFFSDDDIATHTRMVCDYSEFDILKNSFDRDYGSMAKNTWEYRRNNEYFEVTLEEKEWYFVIRTKKK